MVHPTTGTLEQNESLQGQFICKWTIEGFDSLNLQIPKYYYSPTFQFEDEGLDWYIAMYVLEKAEPVRSVFFSITTCNGTLIREKHTSFRSNSSLCNTNNQIFLYLDRLVNDKGICFTKTVKKEDLMSNLVNGTLVISIESIHSAFFSADGADLECQTEFTPTLKIADDFKNLWMSKENADFVISVGDQDISVHSVILGARSKVFAAMFRHNTQETISHRVEVTDFEKDTMDSFLEFIYSGNVQHMDIDLALELLRASDKYEVSDLKSYCSSYLMSHINNDNACHILVSADIYKAELLRSYATTYICKNFLSTEDIEAKRSVFLCRPELLFDIVKTFIEQNKAEKDKSDRQGGSNIKRPRNQ